MDDLTIQFRPTAEDVCQRRGLRLLTPGEAITHHNKFILRSTVFVFPSNRGEVCARGCFSEETISLSWWALIMTNLHYYTDSVNILFRYDPSILSPHRYRIEVYQYSLSDKNQ